MPLSLHMGRLAESYIERTTNLPPIAGFSVLFWFKFTSESVSYPFIWGFVKDSNEYYGIMRSGTTWYIDSCETTTAISPTFVAGQWQHVALTAAGTSGENYFLYLDGVLAGTETCANFTPAYMSFGGLGSANTGYWGNYQFAAIKIYDRVLTLAEIRAEIPWALPYNPAGLNSCYPFPTAWDRVQWGIGAKTGSVSPYVDWSGNGDRIWTVGGTVDLDLGPPIG